MVASLTFKFPCGGNVVVTETWFAKLKALDDKRETITAAVDSVVGRLASEIVYHTDAQAPLPKQFAVGTGPCRHMTLQDLVVEAYEVFKFPDIPFASDERFEGGLVPLAPVARAPFELVPAGNNPEPAAAAEPNSKKQPSSSVDGKKKKHVRQYIYQNWPRYSTRLKDECTQLCARLQQTERLGPQLQQIVDNTVEGEVLLFDRWSWVKGRMERAEVVRALQPAHVKHYGCSRSDNVVTVPRRRTSSRTSGMRCAQWRTLARP